MPAIGPACRFVTWRFGDTADRLAAVSPFGVDYPSTVNFVTRLSGFPLARIENASNCDPARNDLYPEHGQWVPQYKLEQVLREHADSLASIDCDVEEVIERHSHAIVIGRVRDVITSAPRTALTYWDGQYVAIDQNEDALKLAEVSVPGRGGLREV